MSDYSNGPVIITGKDPATITKNPIMPGFYPDPSICAAGGDFYLINSTFAYFPGLPILHSRDLAHWEQAGNAMHRHSQLPLGSCGHSQGLFAPVIRCHGDIFYVICTNVSYGGNYIVTATDPAGPWSEPYYIEGADGIDPSLFFDDDGTCYYIGTHPNPEGCKYDGDWYIWIQELDVKTMRLTGEPANVWNGAMKNIIWPEGPHLYKKDGYYYIMHAEGGTGPHHAVTVCRSRNIRGPYENNFRNPVLTHRHLGKDYPVQYVGHADMIETPAGEWFMVMLAVRPLDGYTTMGRETFLARVDWEDGWPVVNAGTGTLTKEVTVHLPEWNPFTDPESYTSRRMAQGKVLNAVPGSSRSYDFTKMSALGDEFLFLRNYPEDLYHIIPGEGLALRAQGITLKEQASPSYIAVRQQHHCFQAEAVLAADSLKEHVRAGIALLQSNEYHLRAEADTEEIAVYLCEKGEDCCIAQIGRKELPAQEEELTIRLRVNGLRATVEIGKETDSGLLAHDLDIRCLSTEVAGGFVGCTVGMYAVAEEEGHEVTVRRFTYLAQ